MGRIFQSSRGPGDKFLILPETGIVPQFDSAILTFLRYPYITCGIT